MYISTHSLSRHQMEVSYQPHDLATLSPVRTELEAGEHQNLSGCFGPSAIPILARPTCSLRHSGSYWHHMHIRILQTQRACIRGNKAIIRMRV